MNTVRTRRSIAAAAALLSTPALAQLSIPWWTIDGGGGLSSGGGLSVQGTIGQADAGNHSGTGFSAACGYWTVGGPTCYANCDASTGIPALTANDFQCFINKYAAGDPFANCDGSTGIPALTANDFQCFINKYAGGCP